MSGSGSRGLENGLKFLKFLSEHEALSGFKQEAVWKNLYNSAA